MGRAGERFDDGFELRPEADEFQGRIQQVGERAVERVLRIRVVQRVLARRLENPAILEKRDERADLGARHVRPFMDLVRVDAENREEPDVPGEHVGPGGAADDQGAEEQQVPGALPPGQFGEEAGVMMVDGPMTGVSSVP